MKRSLKTCLIITVTLFFAGCAGSTGNTLTWRQTTDKELQNLGRAAHKAFFNWNTLAPLAGAGIFAIDDFDHRVSNWAAKHNPVFGSEQNARDASDTFKRILQFETIGTCTATMFRNDPNDPENPIYAKLKYPAVELAAWGATKAATRGLKHAFSRTRPDRLDNKSFPSGHTSEAFSLATLSNRNLEHLDLPDNWTIPLQTANICLATGTAWARVEGRKHYPTDVLFGAALGHFLSAFIHNYFFDPYQTDNISFLLTPSLNGATIQITSSF